MLFQKLGAGRFFTACVFGVDSRIIFHIGDNFTYDIRLHPRRTGFPYCHRSQPLINIAESGDGHTRDTPRELRPQARLLPIFLHSPAIGHSLPLSLAVDVVNNLQKCCEQYIYIIPLISPVAVFPWLAFHLIPCFPSSAAASIALSEMVSSINTAYFERTSSRQPTSTMQGITNVDNISKRKKHISISREIAIPKTIIFPTATTPTRFGPGHPLLSIPPLRSLTIPPTTATSSRPPSLSMSARR